MSAKIYKVNLSWDDNYVSFNDTDIMIDYFHGYSLNQKETAEWIKKDGADKIWITVTNNNNRIPSERRVKKICKVAGYTAENTSHVHTYMGGSKGFMIEFILKRNASI